MFHLLLLKRLNAEEACSNLMLVRGGWGLVVSRPTLDRKTELERLQNLKPLSELMLRHDEGVLAQ